MKIIKGDKVKVISGKDKGKIGKVTQLFHNEEKVVVEGVNKMVKHLKRTKQSDKGQKIEFFAPVHASNVSVVCSNCNKTTRMMYRILKSGEKERICKKCKNVIKTTNTEEKK